MFGLKLIHCFCRLREQRERAEQRHQDEIESLTKKSAEHKARSDALQADVNSKQVVNIAEVSMYTIQSNICLIENLQNTIS